jgi:medium-chain acyl-[acyl-carrier-protein] hydrolase
MSVKNSRPVCIAYRTPRPQACLRLFCFPYAGSGANIFRSWAKHLPETIELCPVQLPGRETRVREPACARIEPLIEMLSDELKPFLDIPYVFLGYSMGALIAFELARFLRKSSRPGPSHLFLAARRGPRVTDSSPTAGLTDQEFVKEIESMGGVPGEILRLPEVLELVLPTLRADFSLCESYTYLPGRLLDCPLSVFGGKDDPRTTYRALAAWAAETTSSCTVRLFDGDHFFIHNRQDALLETILENLSMNPILAGLPASPSAG